MDRIIRQVAKQLRDLLPEDRDHYRLDELRALGFPDFIKQRIRVELEHNLSESVQMPETDWADMETEAIQSLWAQFEHAVRHEARLPAASAPSVIHIAVADVLNMLVHPREKLPEVIFRDNAELSYEQITERLEVVVVYRHFATLIPRYMQKKNVQRLSKERCAAIIERADERLTNRYTPLNWAQMLEPLFSLINQKIDPELLTLFFEDKNKPRLAKQFASLHAAVDRSGFIEILSSPDSLDLKDQKDKQMESSASDTSKSKETDAEPESKAGQSDTSSQKASRVDISSGEDPIVGAFHKFRENLREKEMPDENTADEAETTNGASLNDIFLKQTKAENTLETSEDEDMTSPEKQKGENGTAGSHRKRDLPESSNKESDKEEDDGSEIVESVFSQSNADEETPMWKRFLSSEELASLDEAHSHAEVEQEIPEKEKKILQKELKNDRSYFIKELFRGSEKAYDEALTKIAGIDDWRSASKYISENVFKRNLVDMYSEAAVDFTDRLHAHFMRKSKS